MSNFVKILDVDQLNPGQTPTVIVSGPYYLPGQLNDGFVALNNISWLKITKPIG